MHKGYLPVISIFCCLMAACTLPKGEKPKSQAPQTLWEIADTTCPLAYTILNLEQWAGLPVNTDEFILVDDFLSDLSAQISPKPAYTRAEALQILQTINQAIKRLRTRQTTYHSALYLCLRYRLFDCDINSILYLTAAQHLHLSMKAFVLPTHMLIVWDDCSNIIYWETTENREQSFAHYQQKYRLQNTDTLPPAMLLSTLNYRQMVAVALFNIGKTYSEMGYPANALLYFTQAQTLVPQWFRPRNAAAHAYLQTAKPDSALMTAQTALQTYPAQPDLYVLMGNAYLLLGCITEAADALKLATTLLAQSPYPDVETITNLNAKADSLYRW